MRKKATLIFILRFIRLAVAVLNLSLSARYFGVSLERDVWLLALNCIVIFDMAIWGPVNDTFRAQFLFLKQEEGETSALLKTRSLLVFTNVITIILVALMMMFSTQLANVIAPSYKGEQLSALVLMIRIVAPSFLINQITKLLASILNAYDSFIIPELIGLITQTLTLILVVTLAASIGIFTLAISYYAGLVLLLIFLVIQLNKLKVRLWDNIFQSRIADVKPFVLFAVPFFFPYFASQINLIIEKALASSLHVGAVATLDYSRKFSDIPLDVLVNIFASLLIPVLSVKFASHKKADFLEEFRKIYQFGFLILVFVIGMLSGCPDAIVNFLYQKGNISVSILQEISRLTMFYSWATFGIFFYQIFGAVLLSAKKGRIFAIYGTSTQVLMIIINLSFYSEFSIYTFPFSLFISHLISGAVMACYFPVPTGKLKTVTFKYTAVLVTIVTASYLINNYLLHFTGNIPLILFNAILLVLLLTAAVFLLKLEERSLITNFVKRWTSQSS